MMAAVSIRRVHIPLVIVVLVVASCGGSSVSADGPSVDIQPVSYLTETIPPCTPIEGTGQDPCEPRPVSAVETLSVQSSIWVFPDAPDLEGSSLETMGVSASRT